MPRGVYDRSKSKAKREAEKATAQATGKPVAKKTWSRRPKAAAAASAAAPTPKISSSPVKELYDHLEVLKGARVDLAQPNLEHSPLALQAIDGEIISTITAMKTWREGRFPAHQPVKSNGEEKTAKAAPSPAPAPVSAPVSTGVPPLPFTPQAVQEVMKQQA